MAIIRPRPLAASHAAPVRRAPLGIHFDEKLSGGFSLDEVEPVAGAKAGRKTPLTFRLAVNAPDLQRFTRDPSHTAQIKGTVAYAPFGEKPIPVTGTLSLLPDAGGKTLMVYTLSFQKDGKIASFVGRKFEGPGFDVWKDTTTLFTELHA